MQKRFKYFTSIFSNISENYHLIIEEIVLPFRKKSFFFISVMLSKSIFEVLMAVSLIPLFTIILGDHSNTVQEASFWKYLFQIQQYFNIENTFIISFLLLMFLTFLKAITTVTYDYIQYGILSEYEKAKRDLLLKRYIFIKWVFFIQNRSGTAINTITGEVIKARQYLSTFIRIIDSGLMVLFYIIAAAYISIVSTILVFIFAIVFLIILLPLLYRIKDYSSQLVFANHNLMQYLGEFLTGLKVVKGARMEDVARNLIERQTENMRKLMHKTGFLKTLPNSLSEPFIIFAVVIAVYLIQTMKIASVSESAVIGFILFRSYQRISTLQAHLTSLYQNLPSLLLVSRTLKNLELNKELKPECKVTRFDSIEFKNVIFSYEQGKNALNGLNFKIIRGDFIGIVGDSGAGKTTLVDLILSLIEPTCGKILVNGKPLKDFDPYSWRTLIGYVPQDSILFNDTIYNNITLHRKDILEKDVFWATKIADADEFILNTAKKYNALIGDRGVKLSGGQKQRLTFARAIVKKPEILLLDEATSSLDSMSENKIQQAVENLRQSMTVIVVAHRLSTIMSADKLLVIDNGKIIETGSPKALLEKNGGKFVTMNAMQIRKSSRNNKDK